MNSDDASSGELIKQDVEVEPQYVVYIMDEDSKIMPYFLAVTDTREEAKEEMNKWWKAFENGEKEKPRGYGGISFNHVSDFERWKAP